LKLAAQAELQNCALPVTGAALRRTALRHFDPERHSLAGDIFPGFCGGALAISSIQTVSPTCSIRWMSAGFRPLMSIALHISRSRTVIVYFTLFHHSVAACTASGHHCTLSRFFTRSTTWSGIVIVS
jgi:hypothetical protein